MISEESAHNKCNTLIKKIANFPNIKRKDKIKLLKYINGILKLAANNNYIYCEYPIWHFNRIIQCMENGKWKDGDSGSWDEYICK